MVGIVDYGVGNLESISNMCSRIGVESVIIKSIGEIGLVKKLILPGVGAFDTCMKKLNDSGMIGSLEEFVLRKKIPILGLCVGMQIMLEGSEEGNLAGLGWIKGKNIKFKSALLPPGYKVPHMGWAEVRIIKHSLLLDGIVDPRYYFVHSYYAELTDAAMGSIKASYGYEFVAGIECDNILGVQFHPEKSHTFGMKLFTNFIEKY